MRKCFSFLLLYFVVVSSFLGNTCLIPNASATPELKIAYVDLEKALAASKYGQAAKKEYASEVEKVSGDLEKKKSELESMGEQFNKQSQSLSQDARDKKAEELMNRKKDLQRLYQDSKESLQRKEQKLLSDLVEKLRAVVQKFGDEKSYTMIFEKNGQAVLYASRAFDITDQVIERFNASAK